LKIRQKRLLGDDSDAAWEWYGAHDPYYGVVSWTEFRKGNLSPDQRQAFFETGEKHVDRVLDIVSRHFGIITAGSCLDFGCGVGRLVIPFAARFNRVVGVDISPSMIAEAQKNCGAAAVRNAEFIHDLSELRERFDLVHSYIVLQHIPVSRGMALIDRLIDAAVPGGICFLHLTIGRNAGVLRNMATFLRKNIKPVHQVLNLLENKRFDEAYMQMNEYNLNRFVAYLHARKISQLWLESANYSGSYNVCAVFRVPPVGAADLTAEPGPH
jgi:cyclopropane fatty-acyl-phospholipid synthase-like methyltransferase